MGRRDRRRAGPRRTTRTSTSPATTSACGRWPTAWAATGAARSPREIACDTLARSFDHHTVDGLVDAIEQANKAVYRAGADDPELTGMGTTVVALAVVGDEDGDQADELLAIANVGDSRGYRWSGGELDQLTTDHSLVADLVREGSLSPDEAAIHPQRNILTRVLGVYDDVPVDAFTVEPRHGDRYVLCSDGLFNEVPEPAIASVLRRLADPADAAEELVRQALEGGGRDNITVVVVDVVDDGGGPRPRRRRSASTASRPGSPPCCPRPAARTPTSTTTARRPPAPAAPVGPSPSPIWSTTTSSPTTSRPAGAPATPRGRGAA